MYSMTAHWLKNSKCINVFHHCKKLGEEISGYKRAYKVYLALIHPSVV